MLDGIDVAIAAVRLESLIGWTVHNVRCEPHYKAVESLVGCKMFSIELRELDMWITHEFCPDDSSLDSCRGSEESDSESTISTKIQGPTLRLIMKPGLRIHMEKVEDDYHAFTITFEKDDEYRFLRVYCEDVSLVSIEGDEITGYSNIMNLKASDINMYLGWEASKRLTIARILMDNVYGITPEIVTEVLHAAALHPSRKVSTLSDEEAEHLAIQFVKTCALIRDCGGFRRKPAYCMDGIDGLYIPTPERIKMHAVRINGHTIRTCKTVKDN